MQRKRGDRREINEAVGEEYEEKQPAQSRAGSRGQDQVAERDAIWNPRIPREKEKYDESVGERRRITQSPTTDFKNKMAIGQCSYLTIRDFLTDFRFFFRLVSVGT